MHSASAFQEVCGRFIRDMGDPDQREGVIRIARVPDGIAAGGGSHVAVDSGGLIRLQLHKLLHQEDGLGAVPTEAVFFFDGIAGHFLPLPIDLLIQHILFIEIDLAEVVEQGRDGNAFLGQLQPIARNALLLHLINIQRMLAQAAVIGTVKAGTGRGGEEVRLCQPGQKILQSFPNVI